MPRYPPLSSHVDLATSFSVEKQKRKAAEERRLAREKRAEEVAQIWEKQILPDWKVVHKNLELRKLWWQGVPTSIRGKMWEYAVGNPLSLSKGNHHSTVHISFSSFVSRFVQDMSRTSKTIAQSRVTRVDRCRYPHYVTEPAPISSRVRSNVWGPQGYALRVGYFAEGRRVELCTWGG